MKIIKAEINNNPNMDSGNTIQLIVSLIESASTFITRRKKRKGEQHST